MPQTKPRNKRSHNEMISLHEKGKNMVCCFGLFCAPSFTCFSLRLRDTLQSPNVQPTRASRASAWASFVGAMANKLVQIGTCGAKPSNFLPSDCSSLASLLKTVHDDLTMFQVTRQVVQTISTHFNLVWFSKLVSQKSRPMPCPGAQAPRSEAIAI